MRYRLYSMDKAGHIAEALDLLCESHSEALALAKTSPTECDRELWLGVDRIALLPFDPAQKH